MNKPCPCYITPDKQPLMTISSGCGVCETKLNCHWIDGIVLSSYLEGNARAPNLQTELKDIYNMYYESIKELKGPQNNCKRTAMAYIYAGYLSAYSRNPTLEDMFISVTTQSICWIKHASAYEGACADTMLSIAIAIGGNSGDSGFIVSLSRNPSQCEQLTTLCNIGIVRIIATHTACCSIEPLVFTITCP